MFSGLKSSISHACHRSWELILAPVCRYLNGVRKFKQVFQSHMTSKLMEPKAESQAYVSPPSNPSSSTLKSESVVKSSHPSCLTLLKHFDIIFIKNYKKKINKNGSLSPGSPCLYQKLFASSTLPLGKSQNNASSGSGAPPCYEAPSYLSRLTCPLSVSPMTLYFMVEPN